MKGELMLTIKAPAGATFALESLDEASAANAKPGCLKRLTVDLLPQRSVEARVRMSVLPK